MAKEDSTLHLINQHLVRMLFDQLHVNFFAIDPVGSYIYRNNSLTKLVGEIDRADLVNEKAWISCQEVMRTKEQQIIEEEHLGHWYLSVKSPLIDNNQVLGVVGFSIDITDRKKQELELKAAKEKAEQAYSSKTEFISVASHEIRSPISNVIAMIDAINENLLELKNSLYDKVIEALNETDQIALIKEIQEKFNKAFDNTKKAKAQTFRSINSLMNLGELHLLQTTGVKPKFETIGLQELLNKIIINSKDSNDNNIEIHFDIKKDVPVEIILDYHNIYEALCTIVNNAIRFSNTSELIIIKVNSLVKNKKNYLEISVQDFGIGITEEQLKIIFKTTISADDKTKAARYRKPSLQLPQVQMKVQASGGEIHVKSILNKGTTVTLLIPYQLASQLTIEQLKKIQSMQVNPSRHILLIEDDIAAQETEKNYLEELGHRVDAASTGNAAIALAAKNKYDLIFLDITLPDMNGISVMHKIQQHGGKEIPFVAITSHTSDDDFDYFMKQGVVLVLTKPVNRQQLKNCIPDIIEAKEKENIDDLNLSD